MRLKSWSSEVTRLPSSRGRCGIAAASSPSTCSDTSRSSVRSIAPRGSRSRSNTKRAVARSTRGSGLARSAVVRRTPSRPTSEKPLGPPSGAAARASGRCRAARASGGSRRRAAPRPEAGAARGGSSARRSSAGARRRPRRAARSGASGSRRAAARRPPAPGPGSSARARRSVPSASVAVSSRGSSPQMRTSWVLRNRQSRNQRPSGCSTPAGSRPSRRVTMKTFPSLITMVSARFGIAPSGLLIGERL